VSKDGQGVAVVQSGQLELEANNEGRTTSD